MPRRDRKSKYLRDRAERRMMRRDQRRRDMDYDYQSDYDYSSDYAGGRDRQNGQDRNDYQQLGDRAYYQDMRDRRGSDYAIRGIGRPRKYDRRDRARDYAEDQENDKEYHEDLKDWTKKLKRYDRFNMPKEQLMASAKQMGVDFEDYDEDEFYAVYLMQVSDYPTISNEPHVYLGMAKSWLEDKDIDIEPSEKLCKYLYEIVMAEEDDD